MIYFKGPKAPDFHFEKSRPSLKRIASQAYRRKKRHARLCILSVPNPPDSLPGTPPPAARFPQAAASSFFPSLFLSKTLPPCPPTGKGRGGLLPPRLPCQHTDTQSGGFFFFFFPPSAARSAAGSVFRARIRGVGERFYTTHHFTLSTLFSVFPLFFHPPPSRRRFHRPGPGEGFSGSDDSFPLSPSGSFRSSGGKKRDSGFSA